ncbi:type II toxin-antitoxin system RelE/ParE family toxin [Acidaminobacter hydrogenoformans]|uniref:Addiction module toxin, RelE/StbE family n=1 Tax=Acidaminobacter hydrogenoformans DSM 2784 TaxID=1120920 RepID=A0A1G5RY22_9FIRM|nr:type II toxin-antitoxin system RelE/ParE family toxin [Acidaminobacter hydrogenoformans]SCZ79014.1 addiction module toxin, RelE/StbE family [Acidaminobacter hydrogenoformans DSM 2784]
MEKSRYTIRLTPIADQDIEEISDYIAYELKNEIAAVDFLKKLEHQILRLEEFPMSCELVTEKLLRLKGYRKLLVNNYIVFYIVDEQKREVDIVRVLYAMRAYKDLL